MVVYWSTKAENGPTECYVFSQIDSPINSLQNAFDKGPSTKRLIFLDVKYKIS